MKIPLTVFTKNMPLSFESLSPDLFPLGIAAMFALFMNSRKEPSNFTWFNKDNKETFKFVPITFGWKISRAQPSGSLAF